MKPGRDRGKRLLAALLAAGLTTGLFGCGAAPGGSGVSAKAGRAVKIGASGEKNIPGQPVPKAAKPALKQVLTPTAPGTVTYGNQKAVIDASNLSKGYVMVKAGTTGKKIKVQITKKGGIIYTYDLNGRNQYEVFPLTEGDGPYTINVYENVKGDKYAICLGKTVTVKLENSFLPFLYPNQYVSFQSNSKSVALASRLAQKQTADIGTVQAVYDYVIHNISYDQKKADHVRPGYLPNPDQTLASKKGICFDYASLMTAMLRSQNIPCKLVVGYSDNLYHAWISVYLKDVGWVDHLIYFDGTDWKLMDPTFAASAKNSQAIQRYIGDGTHYQELYTY